MEKGSKAPFAARPIHARTPRFNASPQRPPTTTGSAFAEAAVETFCHVEGEILTLSALGAAGMGPMDTKGRCTYLVQID